MYPGVWLFIALLAIGYWALVRRLVPQASHSRGRRGLHAAAYLSGLLCLWIALDWPVGALGAGYLASAHMVQFLLIALIAPPLLLNGIAPAAYRALESRRAVHAALKLVTHPLIAIAIFNVLLVATHWPTVVDALMVTQLGSFALDMAWLAAGLVLWWPIVAPVPSRPWFSYLYKVGYLILATILSTPTFILLTFSSLPLYATYELAPPVSGMSTRVDQQVAGLLMKIGGGLIFWAAITVLFFRWYRAEEANTQHPSS